MSAIQNTAQRRVAVRPAAVIGNKSSTTRPDVTSPSVAVVERLPLPDGPTYTTPGVDDTLKLMEGPLQYGVENYKKYGPICKVAALGREMYMLSTTTDITKLLQEDGYTVVFHASPSFEKLMTRMTTEVSSF